VTRLGPKTTVKFTAPSLTRQSFKEECNLRNVVARYTKLGIPPPRPVGTPIFGDFTDIEDYHSAVNQLRAAQDQFDGLPSQLRDRFNNSPAELLMFVLNTANRDEAVKLGLIPAPPPPETPQLVRLVDNPKPDAPPPTPATK